MAIFGHLNLYQSFWEKLLEKNQNSHFWPFQIYTSLFGKNCWKKFGRAIFGHSKFIPVFLGKLLEKDSEQPFLAIPNLYQSFWEKLLEKIENSHFWPFQKKLLDTSLFGKNCWKKFRTAIFGHSKFIPVFLGKIWNEPFLTKIYSSCYGRTAIFGHSKKKILEKIENSHFWPFQIYTSLFGKNCWKKLRTAIFGHSKFIAVCLGKIIGKN